MSTWLHLKKQNILVCVLDLSVAEIHLSTDRLGTIPLAKETCFYSLISFYISVFPRTLGAKDHLSTVPSEQWLVKQDITRCEYCCHNWIPEAKYSSRQPKIKTSMVRPLLPLWTSICITNFIALTSWETLPACIWTYPYFRVDQTTTFSPMLKEIIWHITKVRVPSISGLLMHIWSPLVIT